MYIYIDSIISIYYKNVITLTSKDDTATDQQVLPGKPSEAEIGSEVWPEISSKPLKKRSFFVRSMMKKDMGIVECIFKVTWSVMWCHVFLGTWWSTRPDLCGGYLISWGKWWATGGWAGTWFRCAKARVWWRPSPAPTRHVPWLPWWKLGAQGMIINPLEFTVAICSHHKQKSMAWHGMNNHTATKIHIYSPRQLDRWYGLIYADMVWSRMGWT